MTETFDRLKTALADRYTIEREIGAGGMATVYLAEDLKHHRDVAVKVLRPELAAALGADRFHQEIEIAANLNHPHILPLLDSGEAEGFLFFVMPFVEGQSLRDKLAKEGELPIVDAVKILREVVDALAHAHEHNVVHRDIKPDNVMLSGRHALVTDFGVAKAVSEATGSNKLTTEGVALGTPAYMSPEQAAADPHIDHRADIYAIGVIAYELLTGRTPFIGTTQQELLAAHVTQVPDPVTKYRESVPPVLEQLVLKCLEKKAADRWQTAEELLGQIEAMGTPTGGVVPITQSAFGQPVSGAGEHAVAAEKSIAVLPFVNMSPDPEMEYFSDGMTEEIINALTQLEDLRVAARTSSFWFKGKSPEIAEAGEKLNVATVLEGSVRRAGNKLRITAQLVNVADGYHIWSERYDREMEDVFAIQDEIATTIADRFRVTLGQAAEKSLATAPTEHLKAYDLYLKGRFFWEQRGDGLRKGLDCFKKALEVDPDYALAHAGVADAYCLLSYWGVIHPNDAMPKAEQAITRALQLDDKLVEAHCTLAFKSMAYDWDWAVAAREFKRAIALNPRYGPVHYWYPHYLVFVEGQFDTAIVEARKAVELDPLSTPPTYLLGSCLQVAGQYEESMGLFRSALDREPASAIFSRGLGGTYRLLGMYDESVKVLESSVMLSRRNPWALLELVGTYVLSGRIAEARAIYDELMARSGQEYIQWSVLGWSSLRLGLMDEAYALLERAYQEREGQLVWLRYWPEFDLWRDDPRFDDLVRRMKFPQ